MLYIYLLCPHSEHPKKNRSNLNGLNTFTKETSSNKVKLPKVGSNAIVPTKKTKIEVCDWGTKKRTNSCGENVLQKSKKIMHLVLTFFLVSHGR